jgi:hypothetical protein
MMRSETLLAVADMATPYIRASRPVSWWAASEKLREPLALPKLSFHFELFFAGELDRADGGDVGALREAGMLMTDEEAGREEFEADRQDALSRSEEAGEEVVELQRAVGTGKKEAGS